MLDERTLSTLAEDIGDRGFVLDTIEVFLAELPERVAGIARGITAGLPGDVKAVSHSLKSSAAMLGALRLSQLCADLEHQAAAGSTPPIRTRRSAYYALRPPRQRQLFGPTLAS